MDPAGMIPDWTGFLIQEIGTVLFGAVFLYLYGQSRAVYFGLWSAAWGLRLMAGLCGFALLRASARAGWLAAYATFEFAFVIVLVAAARAGFASSFKDWRTVLRLIAILPIFVALAFALGWYSHAEGYELTDALAVATAYIYNFFLLGHQAGRGGRAFRVVLLALAVAYLAKAGLTICLVHLGAAPSWARHLLYETHYEFILNSVLAYCAMAMWGETEMDRLRDLSGEIDHLRRESQQNFALDHLTGLLNQAALARRVDEPPPFEGVVAVCDMDNFKDINDRYGHLTGDEILRNIGHLLHASIRHEDEAFRWGGDEFVLLFHNQQLAVANKRMTAIEARLHDFRVRGVGVLPISFSWGTADAHGRALRDALDEADHNMYAFKRQRFGPPGVGSR
jgi:diguanylate cyclase (GGDEF)-like protein